MKNVKKGKVIQRVSEASAQDRDKLKGLLEQGWSYCSNHEWRAFRDAKGEAEMFKDKKKKNKKAKALTKKQG
jgi:hypothetical protein|tara:strand:- start:407 stop:622 length:216 start_codon:yes stop_codon:yes gene_type:complete